MSSDSVIELYVYLEFTREDGCSAGDGRATLSVTRNIPECSNSNSYIESRTILPSQSLLSTRISNREWTCCSGFSSFKLLVFDENTTNEDREEFEMEDPDYFEERNNDYSYLELLELLGDNEIVEIN